MGIHGDDEAVFDVAEEQRAAVRRGALLLDHEKPDWATMVAKYGPLTGLSMRSPQVSGVGEPTSCGCVLARNYTDYWEGKLRLLGVIDAPTRYGFVAYDTDLRYTKGSIDGALRQRYDQLAELWNEQVKLRGVEFKL